MPAKAVPHTSPATWKALIFHAASLAILINAFQTLKAPCEPRLRLAEDPFEAALTGCPWPLPTAPLGNYIEKQAGSWYQFLTVLG